VGHIVRSGEPGADPIKSTQIHVTVNMYFFASGVIYLSHSEFWCVRGMKHRRSIFHAQVGSEWIPQEVHRETLLYTYVFLSGATCRSHSVFRCVRCMKC
jgi:hypothetical protein